jgi:hypothetical protein
MSDPLQQFHRISRIRTAAAWVVVALVAGYILLNCSGLSYPILRPTDDLRDSLRNAYDVELPASAVVEHANRQATLRTLREFSLRMNPTEIRPFVDAIRLSSERRGKQPVERDVQDLPPIRPAPPAWFSPATIPQVRWLDVMPPGRGAGLWVFYSEQEGRVLLLWYSM